MTNRLYFEHPGVTCTTYRDQVWHGNPTRIGEDREIHRDSEEID